MNNFEYDFQEPDKDLKTDRPLAVRMYRDNNAIDEQDGDNN
jgi:hypothetical protein